MDEFPFVAACRDDDVAALVRLLSSEYLTPYTLNQTDKTGRTGLSHASEQGFMDILRPLGSLEGMDVNIPDNEGNTPLIFAAEAGQPEAVKFLIQNFPDINIDQENENGLTALIKAAIQGQSQTASLLLEAGASVLHKDKMRGMNAQEWALYCGRKDCADSIAKFLKTKKTWFKKHGTPPCIRQKQQHRQSISEPDLIYAVKNNDRGLKVNFQQTFRRIFSRCTGNKKRELTPNKQAFQPLVQAARCASSPLLPDIVSPPNSPMIFKRECVNQRPIMIVPKVNISP
ncbi:ankyrin repeat domain-containing protein 33B [Lingula anatina]|uniref:Ankyrin repeat domain-containing protein 33B n=1 Tax=Lingula anatina TaxID=7574 RepID=A0A1S3H549_LINAN|nr:ankyrin repeat domain-containing protein 33B [Lingula anatina]|eukprot:XP_013381092.1 ankyrin repeat domain-containing protein 33B [Lingula anatina]